MLRTLLILILIISGIALVGAVLLMSPKGGLGIGVAGMGGSGEYGSKKNIEGRLKKVAIIAAVVFVICAVVLPYASN